MRRNHFKSMTVILLFFLAFFSTHGQTAQQAEGIDLILLIDESGSMGGYGEHPQPNDPHNKRNELLHIILTEIIESAYKGNVFRVSVIEFGSRHGAAARWQPQVTLSMFKFQEPKTGESKSDYHQRVSAELAFLKNDRTRGYSDHGKALDLALQEMNKMDKHPVPVPLGQVGQTQRLKVVFLITDGMPYVRSRDGSPLPAGTLKREIREIVRNFPPQKAILFIFGLNAADKYWDDLGYGDYWDLVAATTSDDKQNKGYAQFIDNHIKIIEQVLPVLSKYTNPPGVAIIHGDTYDCPPYLKSLEFIVEFPRSFMKVSQVLEITQPDGTLLDTANAREQKVNAYIDVPYPMGGVWRFNRKDPDIRLMIKKMYREVKFLSPLSPVHLQSTHKIKFKAMGPGENNSFVQDPGYPVTATILIETPQNTKDVLNASLVGPNEPGVFVSNTAYRFKQLAPYQVEFEASTVSGTGSPVQVLKSDKVTLQVTESTPVRMVLEEPVDKIHASFGSVDQGFNFGFYTSDGRKISPQEILKTNDKIEADAEITDASSHVTIMSTGFSLQQKNNSLVGAVEMKLPITDIFNIIFGKRDLEVIVKCDNRFIKDEYFLITPANESHLYEFPLKIREWIWTYLLLLVIVVVVFALMGFLFLWFGGTMCSEDIPLLVYRQDSYLPDEQYTREIEVDKRKLKIKKGDKTFFIPDSEEVWKPGLIINRNCTDRGVNVTVTYEKFGKKPGERKRVLQFFLEKLKLKPRDESKERFRKFNLQTIYPRRPSKHRIEELKDKEMIFELRVKEI